MAAVMVFPYVSSFPAVMASDGSLEVQDYEITIEELQIKYENIQQDLSVDERIIAELEQYLSVNEIGELTLTIPSNVKVDVSDEEILKIREQLNFVNAGIMDGVLTVEQDEEGTHIYQVDFDDEFVAQANDNSFSVRWYGNRIRLDYTTMKSIYTTLSGYVGSIATWKNAFTASVSWSLIKYAFQHPSASSIGWAVLDLLPNSLGAFLAYAAEAIAGVLASPYFLIAVVVVGISSIYNYSKIKTAGTSWKDGTEIRTYGVYAYIPASTAGIFFPNYREQ